MVNSQCLVSLLVLGRGGFVWQFVVGCAVACLVGFCVLHSEKGASASGLLISEITGENYKWSIRYPGRDGVEGDLDDFTEIGDLKPAAGIPTKIVLKSNDFLHGFELPDVDLTEIAVPDLVFSLEFTPDTASTFQLRGHQMRDYTHSQLNRSLKVQAVSDFSRWSQAQSRSSRST